jgi:hypothetical protein
LKEREGFQKLELKLHLERAEGHDAETVSDRLLVVFGRWRLEEGEEIIDLEDYAHVPQGPGVILVSHRFHLGIDWGGGQPGLFYSTRKGLHGTLLERIQSAARGLLEKGRRLLREAEISPCFTPRAGDLEVIANDRLLFPNSSAGDSAFRPALEDVARKLYGEGAVIEREPDPARRLGYRVRAPGADALALEELAARLAR